LCARNYSATAEQRQLGDDRRVIRAIGQELTHAAHGELGRYEHVIEPDRRRGKRPVRPGRREPAAAIFVRATQPPSDEPLVVARLRRRVEIAEDDDRAALLCDQLRQPSHLSIPDPRIRHAARRQRVDREHGQRSAVQRERRA